MTIPTLPPLERTSPSFAADLDKFFAIDLPATIPAFNTEISRINGIGFGSYSSSSTTNLVSGPGSKTFTVETGKSFTAGQYLMATSVSSPSVFMSGQVTSYDPLTGALVLSVTDTGGAGTTKADWSIAPSAVVLRPTKVGDVFQGAVKPTADTWLPLGGSLYLQSSYAELFGLLGILSDAPFAAKHWTEKTMPSEDEWGWLAYGNGTFVALKQLSTDKCATSTDGSTWTERTMSSTKQWCGVAFGAGVFVVIASSGGSTDRVQTSTDGITWTPGTMPSVLDWSSITYANGMFICIGTNKCAKSTDGYSWTETPIGYSTTTSQIAFGNGTFIATSASAPNIYISNDNGASWVEKAIDQYFYSIVFGNGLFVATTDTNYCYTSYNGTTWVARDMPIFGGEAKLWRGASYGGGVFVAFNGYDTTQGAMSIDGKTWDPITMPTASRWSSSVFGDGFFVVVCRNVSTVAAKSDKIITYDKATQFFLPESVNTPGIAQWIRGL